MERSLSAGGKLLLHGIEKLLIEVLKSRRTGEDSTPTNGRAVCREVQTACVAMCAPFARRRHSIIRSRRDGRAEFVEQMLVKRLQDIVKLVNHCGLQRLLKLLELAVEKALPLAAARRPAASPDMRIDDIADSAI